ncbi:cysteine dioxygenase [Streptomyces sp. WMMC897]|uniref:cysteine dioxygenase n=1 Tax=Streptomyces sp. WMMC897 TaxID=3014782 RepID=UPI0022B72913|nr:cysteine dioxygenase [Streptomyces sp. WMMC897]MCZ7414598.1 cysteine dioxygenase [Streptomyces sp. WMMC897]
MNSDVEIAGDILAVPHLLPPAPKHPSTVAGLAGLAARFAADRETWEPLVRYDAGSRRYRRLRSGPSHEVWLLSWVPGQSTTPHAPVGPAADEPTGAAPGAATAGTGTEDVPGLGAGVLAVLAGRLTERVGPSTRTLTPGTRRVFAPGPARELVNDALEPAVALLVVPLPTPTAAPLPGRGEASTRTPQRSSAARDLARG